MQICNNNLKVESSANGMTNFSALVAITLLLLVMALTIASRNVMSLCRTELTGYPCLIFVICYNYNIFGTKNFTPKNILKSVHFFAFNLENFTLRKNYMYFVRGIRDKYEVGVYSLSNSNFLMIMMMDDKDYNAMVCE